MVNLTGKGHFSYVRLEILLVGNVNSSMKNEIEDVGGVYGSEMGNHICNIV